MGMLGKALNYPALKAGLILLILALLISMAGFYKVDRFYHSSGTIGKGMHRLGADKFENEYLYHNRTLTISSSHNATFSLIQGTELYNYTIVNDSITLHPKTRPVIYVFNGTVNYTYDASAVDYPYAVYSILAFVFMIVGIVLSFFGYAKFLRDSRGSVK